jgi:hypothetical protein
VVAARGSRALGRRYQDLGGPAFGPPRHDRYRRSSRPDHSARSDSDGGNLSGGTIPSLTRRRRRGTTAASRILNRLASGIHLEEVGCTCQSEEVLGAINRYNIPAPFRGAAHFGGSPDSALTWTFIGGDESRTHAFRFPQGRPLPSRQGHADRRDDAGVTIRGRSDTEGPRAGDGTNSVAFIPPSFWRPRFRIEMSTPHPSALRALTVHRSLRRTANGPKWNTRIPFRGYVVDLVVWVPVGLAKDPGAQGRRHPADHALRHSETSTSHQQNAT